MTEGTHDSTVVSITDDDVPQVTASFEQDTYSVAEGDTVSIKVVLSADPERTVTIPILTADQNGATAADYTVPAQVVFQSGDTEKTLSFQAVDDSVDDDGESVQLSLGTLPTGVTEGTHDSTVVSIVDGDVPQVTASFEQDSYSVAEGDTVSIKVVLSADRPSAPSPSRSWPLTRTARPRRTTAWRPRWCSKAATPRRR